jgi:ferredoxin
MKRNVIKIDEEKCDGCGLCIPNCPEGAIQVIDGKARLISDLFCDGLGACIGHCPKEAITVEEREAQPYDEAQVMENVARGGPGVIRAHLDHLKEHGQAEYLSQALAFLRQRSIEIPDMSKRPSPEGHPAGCPGSKMMDFREDPTEANPAVAVSGRSRLGHWPVQLQLVNTAAPYFKDADLLIAADCVPFAFSNFHERFLKGKTLIILCPKLDRMPEAYIDKLAEIFRNNNIKSVTVAHMEVPCCFGLVRLVEEAMKRSGKRIEIEDYTVSIRGSLVDA